jgi:hypothetical protein
MDLEGCLPKVGTMAFACKKKERKKNIVRHGFVDFHCVGRLGIRRRS